MYMKNEPQTPSPKYYKAKSADIIGDVRLSDGCSVFYNAVLRGDEGAIILGENTNIQDGVIAHAAEGYDVILGKNVTVGHGAILHGCEIGDNCVIGMGSIIMNGAKIGKNCIIGAGAIVTEHTEIEDGAVAFGAPARVKKLLGTEKEKENIDHAMQYVELAKKQLVIMEA